MFQIYNDGEYEMNNLTEFNKTHITRVFPSKHKKLRTRSNNYNPVLAWSLGCQIASINQQLCDAFVLVNDGRFRTNGSCGYVLKPELMIERKGGDIRTPFMWECFFGSFVSSVDVDVDVGFVVDVDDWDNWVNTCFQLMEFSYSFNFKSISFLSTSILFFFPPAPAPAPALPALPFSLSVSFFFHSSFLPLTNSLRFILKQRDL